MTITKFSVRASKAVNAALNANVGIALAAIKSISVSDKTMDIRRLYPTYKEAIAVTVGDACATDPSMSTRLKAALVKARFDAQTLRSTVMLDGSDSRSLDVIATSSDELVEVFFSSLNGLAIVLESHELT